MGNVDSKPRLDPSSSIQETDLSKIKQDAAFLKSVRATEPGAVTLIGPEREILGYVAKSRGPVYVDVKEYLTNKLSCLVDKSIEDNRRLNEYVLLSLSYKRQNKGACRIRTYLSLLDKLCSYDLELCASLMGGVGLQLVCGEYYQLSRIRIKPN